MRSVSSGSASSHRLTVSTATLLSLPAVHQSVYFFWSVVIVQLIELSTKRKFQDSFIHCRSGSGLNLSIATLTDEWSWLDMVTYYTIHVAVCSCWRSPPVLPLGAATSPLRASPLQLVLLRDVSRFSQVGLTVKSWRFMALNIGQRFVIFTVLLVSNIIVAGVYILIVLLTRQSNDNVQWRLR